MNFNNICTEKEASFLFDNIKSTDNVLEYGSGALAMKIADKVKHVSVITHDINQYGDIVTAGKPENLEIIHVPTNKTQVSDDGTFEEFQDYINAGYELKKRFGKFNVIIIRGRARVECAKFAKEIAQEGCKIFVQDYAHPNPEYTRHEYFEIEKHLFRITGEFTMHLFILTDSIEYFKKQEADELIKILDENKVFEISDTKIETESTALKITMETLKDAYNSLPENATYHIPGERKEIKPPIFNDYKEKANNQQQTTNNKKLSTKKLADLPKEEQKRVKKAAKKIAKGKK